MSEKQTHTPGPWYEYQSEKDSHKSIASKCGKRIAKHVPNANARLIASAPELLEQCKLFEKLLKAIGDMGYEDEIDLDSYSWLMRTMELRKVLARVEGETA